MSASSIARAAADTQLQARIVAMTNKEIIFNAALFDSWFGMTVRAGMASWNPLYWSVAVDTEAAYEAALMNGRGAPGHDVDIITDAALTSAITTHWPEQVVFPPPVTPPVTP